MGLRDIVPSFVREAWDGARPHVVKILTNAMVCGTYLLVMGAFDVVERLRPVDDLAGQIAGVIVSCGELAFIIMFLVMSIIGEIRQARGNPK